MRPWIVDYKKADGRKHIDTAIQSVNKISAVCYSIEPDEDNPIHGATFAFLYDGMGNTHDLSINPI